MADPIGIYRLGGAQVAQLKTTATTQARVIEHLREGRRLMLEADADKTMRSRVTILQNFKQQMRLATLSSKDRTLREYTSRMHNKTDSLLGGLLSEDYSAKDIAALRESALKRLRKLIKAEKAKPTDKPTKEEADAAKAANKEKETSGEFDDEFEEHPLGPKAQREDSIQKLNALLKDAPMVIKKYKGKDRFLADIVNKRYIFARVPIIPLVAPMFDSDILKKKGYTVEKIGTYSVLEGQLVLGLNVNYVKESQESIRRDAEQLADFLVKNLSKRQNKTYHILGPATPGKHTGLFYWVASEKEVNAMMIAAGKRKFKVHRWGFAF